VSWTQLFTDLESLLDADVKVYSSDPGEHTRPPAIYWEPRSATHVPAERLRGETTPGDLWVREINVLVRIWGTSVETADALLETFVQLVHRTSSMASYQIAGEEWNVGSRTTKGATIDLTLIVRVPIRRGTTTTATIEQIRAKVLAERGGTDETEIVLGEVTPPEDPPA
jgi:hypothetical protein